MGRSRCIPGTTVITGTPSGVRVISCDMQHANILRISLQKTCMHAAPSHPVTLRGLSCWYFYAKSGDTRIKMQWPYQTWSWLANGNMRRNEMLRCLGCAHLLISRESAWAPLLLPRWLPEALAPPRPTQGPASPVTQVDSMLSTS